MNLHTRTPVLSVFEPRGLSVRSVAFCRAQVEDVVGERVDRAAYDLAGRRVDRWDPRLWAVVNARSNLRSVHALSGRELLNDSVDAGWRLELLAESGDSQLCWDAKGQRRRIEYDDCGRPVAVFESEGASENCVERLGYGGPDKALTNQAGRLIRHDDPAGSLFNSYYGLGAEVIGQSRKFLSALDLPDWPLSAQARDALLEPGDGAVSAWRFDALGNGVEQTDAAGNRQWFTQTVSGHLKSTRLQLNGQAAYNVVSDIHYDAQNRIESQTAGNGVVSSQVFDAVDGRLLNLRADNGRLQNLYYAYDPAGNVLSIKDLAQPTRYFANQQIEPLRTFAYDTLHQLIEATGYEAAVASQGPEARAFSTATELSNYTQRYEYDAGGNMQKMTHTGAHNHTRLFATARYSNRSLLQIGDQAPTEEQIAAGFDPNGNLRELQPGQSLGWDVSNQLGQVTPVQRCSGLNDSEIYRYDAGGMRVRKVHTAQAKARIHLSEVRYLPGLEIRTNSATGGVLYVVAATAGHSAVRVLHWLTGKPAGLRNDQIRYSLTDHLGSATLELDADGAVISQEVYYAFGETAWFAARSEIEAQYKTIRYSGKECDVTRLYYYGMRYYAPWLMRWINPDPAGAVDGLNLYRFVRNNPSTFEDVLGMMPWDSFESEVDRTRLKALRAMERALTVLENDAESVGDEVMERFFGSSDADLKGRFKRDIEKTIELAKATKAKNFELIKDSGSPLVAEVDMLQYRYFSVYQAAKRRVTERGLSPADLKRELFEKRTLYAQERKTRFLKVGQRMWNKTRNATNANYMAQVLIHEFSHAAIDTRDFAYGKAKEGVDPTPLFELATGGEVEPLCRGAEFEQRLSVPSIDQAYKNADSFAGAVMFLKRAKSRKPHETALYRRYVESR